LPSSSGAGKERKDREVKTRKEFLPYWDSWLTSGNAGAEVHRGDKKS
jgi:hypothetical protein